MRSKRKLKTKVKKVLRRIGIILLLCMLFNHNGKITKDNTLTITYYAPVGVPNRINDDIYRLTHYYTGDSTNSTTITASGLSTNQFQVNNKGWYTYQGKLVMATANTRLLSWDQYKNSTQKTYNLYDEFTIVIDGIDYKAIALDVCGACMSNKKIDLFVAGSEYGIDRKEVQVIYE